MNTINMIANDVIHENEEGRQKEEERKRDEKEIV